MENGKWVWTRSRKPALDTRDDSTCQSNLGRGWIGGCPFQWINQDDPNYKGMPVRWYVENGFCLFFLCMTCNRGDWYEDQTNEWHYGWLGKRYVFLNDLYTQKRAGGGGFQECYVMKGPNGEQGPES